MVSSPSYDPNLFVTGISEKAYRQLNQSRNLPLFNRSIQGQYPPGSTIKPLLGLGALEYGIITSKTRIPDPGFYQLENDDRLYRDWKPEGHGAHVDIHDAIVESCDVFFYDLGFRMGVDRMHAFGQFFGLGEKSYVDIPSERSGLWPSREWKKKTRGLHWYPGNSLNMSIGQGDVLATPLQLAQMTATLARKGDYIEPRLAKSVDGVPTEKIRRSNYEGEDDNWDVILKSMRDVVHGIKGTAHVVAKGMAFEMAGKTGTAQVVSIAQDGEYDSESLSERNRDHALFVGYAPFDDPKIAVAVVIENGEKSSEAGIVAREVMSEYLKHSSANLEYASGQ
jgi:penicillin-binding protein 2